MLHAILGHDHLQWHPPLINHFTKSWRCYRAWTLLRLRNDVHYFVVVRMSSDMTIYGMAIPGCSDFVHQFSTLFSYVLWQSGLDCCMWFCFNTPQTNEITSVTGVTCRQGRLAHPETCYRCILCLHLLVPYIGIFSRRAILAKITPGRCVNCSLSPNFAIWRVVNRDLLQCLIFAMCIFSDLEEIANSAKIKPTRKIPDIRYYQGSYKPFRNLLCFPDFDYLPSLDTLNFTCSVK